MLFRFNNNNHSLIIGVTRSGKTYFFKKSFENAKKKVLYLNPQEDIVSDSFYQFDETVPLAYVETYLYKKKVLEFNQRYDENYYASLIGWFMNNRALKERYLVVDEGHLMTGKALKALRRAVTGGLSKGLKVVVITQRPALIDATIKSQCLDTYIFRLPKFDIQYLRSKGYDADKISEYFEKSQKKYPSIYTDGLTYQFD